MRLRRNIQMAVCRKEIGNSAQRARSTRVRYVNGTFSAIGPAALALRSGRYMYFI
jgi:hypothetical protein